MRLPVKLEFLAPELTSPSRADQGWAELDLALEDLLARGFAVSDTETIERIVDRMITLPAPIHLGPERILDRFREVHISKVSSDGDPVPGADTPVAA